MTPATGAKAGKAYQKIGYFQSVIPVPVNRCGESVFSFGPTTLKFTFRDSGAIEDDGWPIWIAVAVEVLNAE